MNQVNKGVTIRHTPRYLKTNNDYFNWMQNLVCGEYSDGKEWNKLLSALHNIDFIYILDMDANRADDGKDLRYRFFDEISYPGASLPASINSKPCSVLEMMVALAIRCEEHIMDDPDSGDRTGKWFFEMVKSLQLYSMTDDGFEKDVVYERVDRFLKRQYSPNGRGGLFTVTNARQDMRDIEVWYQMMWYLDDIIYGRR